MAARLAISAIRPLSETSRFRKTSNIDVDESVHELPTRSRLSLNYVASVGASQRHGVPVDLRRQFKSISGTRTAANKLQNHAAVICRAASHVDKYGQCKCVEDALSSIMTDAIQHCLGKENDVMRSKVLDQMGKGLAALCRVSVGVAAESSNAPVPITSMVPELLSTIRDEDLEQVQRLLHLTSLPFQSTEDEDFKRLMKMLQKIGNGQNGSERTLSESELSQICERLGSDLVQCIGPIVMCFPQLPLWAKHRALLLPAEVAGKVALSLLSGPSSRR